LIVHRVSKWKYASLTALEEHGYGAARYGSRWNSPDPALQFNRRIIYASDTLPLAMLEVIVHVDAEILHRVQHGHVTFQVDETFIHDLTSDALPDTWNARPETPATQVIGDEWYDTQASVVLRVPSAVLPLDSYGPMHANYLINAHHPDVSQAVQLLTTSEMPFDPRLR
jgi:RES domain-containing protein